MTSQLFLTCFTSVGTYFFHHHSKQSSLPQIVQKTFAVNYSKENWLATPISTHKASKESGATEQFKVQLSRNNDCFIARAKKIDTLNEAMTYYQMSEKKDSLHSFLPTFIGVFDENGKQIDLEDLLTKHAITEICKMKEYQSAYLVMTDLLDALAKEKEIKIIKNPKDFKFIRESLQGSDIEADLHCREKIGFVYKAVRKVFFGLSKCSFAFQKSTKSSWYNIVMSCINRILSVKKTKLALEKQFKRLPFEQLKKMQKKLKELHTAIPSSNYAMADSSLLLIPIQRSVEGKQVNDLEIKLIDLTYAFSADEVRGDAKGQEEHQKMKKDMQASIEELIGIVERELFFK